MTPIRIKVDPSHDASKVKAEGPGISRSGKTDYSAGCLALTISIFLFILNAIFKYLFPCSISMYVTSTV